jgi:hypothetical protein
MTAILSPTCKLFGSASAEAPANANIDNAKSVLRTSHSGLLENRILNIFHIYKRNSERDLDEAAKKYRV